MEGHDEELPQFGGAQEVAEEEVAVVEEEVAAAVAEAAEKRTKKRSRAAPAAPRAPPAAGASVSITGFKCRVAGCAAPEDASELKRVNQRAKACPEHLKSLALEDENLGTVRFCQRCAKWEDVALFEGTKRTCMTQLRLHNEKRRLVYAAKAGRKGHEAEEEEEEEGAEGPVLDAVDAVYPPVAPAPLLAAGDVAEVAPELKEALQGRLRASITAAQALPPSGTALTTESAALLQQALASSGVTLPAASADGPALSAALGVSEELLPSFLAILQQQQAVTAEAEEPASM